MKICILLQPSSPALVKTKPTTPDKQRMDAAGNPKLTLLSIYEACLEKASCFQLAFAGGEVGGAPIKDRFRFFWGHEQKKRNSQERRQRRQWQVSGSLKSHQEKMKGRRRCLRERQRCPALSFYSPKTEEREVWPEDRGSDGEKE